MQPPPPPLAPRAPSAAAVSGDGGDRRKCGRVGDCVGGRGGVATSARVSVGGGNGATTSCRGCWSLGLRCCWRRAVGAGAMIRVMGWYRSRCEARFGVPGADGVYGRPKHVLLEDADGVQVLVAGDGNVRDAGAGPVTRWSAGWRMWRSISRSVRLEMLGSDLHVVSLDGGDEALLVHEVAGEFYAAPRWLADGSALVYAHQVEGSDEAGRTFLVDVERIDLASGAVTVLRENARDGDISPDGRLLVFVDEPAIADRLVVQDLARRILECWWPASIRG